MLARRTPMRRKRKSSYKPAAVRQHFARIAALGCLVCGGTATIHHVSSDGCKRIARSDQLVAPLCPRHHQIIFGPRESVEALGHAGFTATYGIDLFAWAQNAWSETQNG